MATPHEIRTPLTLIKSQFRNLLLLQISSEDRDPGSEIMDLNTNRLLLDRSINCLILNKKLKELN